MNTAGDNHHRDDFRVRDLGNTVLQVRSDLAFVPQAAGGRQGYTIEDAVNSKYYRLGMAEYHFVSLLDGKRTVREAMAMTATARPDDALTEHDVATLCQWLIDMDLAHTDRSSGADRLHVAAAKAARQQNIQRINPIFIRIPLLCPDRLLAAIYPWTGWLFSPVALLGWLVLMAWAGWLLTADSERFMTSAWGIFSPSGYLGILGCWLLLKVVHELGHGLACRRFGGYVREAGVVLLLFLPIAYIDVSSSWRFRAKLQRIIVAAAGMYVELALAALAAIGWSLTETGPLNQLFANFVLMASVTTILFNANPLMRFDGYYILSDSLEIPNLYASGQQYMRYAGRRWLMGLNSVLPPWPTRAARFIKIYAVTSFGWRIFICTALVVTAATLFHGAGIVIAVLGLVAWVAVPGYRFIKFVFTGDNLRWGQRGRLAVTTLALTAAVVGVFWLCPWPFASRAPAYVEYDPLTVVRAASTGFVREVHVQNGQTVTAGDVLVVLENEDLQVQLEGLKLSIEKSRLKSNGYQTRHEMAAYQSEQKQIESLLQQKAEREVQVQQLTVRAPTAGTVVRRRLDMLLGTYLKQGDEIVSIGNDQQKEVRLSVAQEDVEFFQSAVGQPVRVRVAGGEKMLAQLTKLEPRATRQPPHLSLCASNGGSLVVQHKEQSSQNNAAGETVELIAPRFNGTVTLEAGQGAQLFSGQRAMVQLTDRSESVGGHLYRSFQHWLKQKIDAASRG
ncbi:MAG: HlyD family efflux transporter periplasmic adaptor subunit [Planctomycetota bacterium]|nr:HlyD family efflux transporter periplasmic adaptor subunit [Planctomycetota bacterium]